jgi:hypothetical protein
VTIGEALIELFKPLLAPFGRISQSLRRQPVPLPLVAR